ncbi:MAG: NADH-quinone oxidoreductase subunit K [Kiritimatiellaeota bacterium]|nr:NADH-quinone oxidoreductase subunit K [Kiritimatiellota bacterium]
MNLVALVMPFGVFVALMAVVGLYCLIVTRDMLRILLALEIITKAVTLLLIVGGMASGHMALAQTLVITLIVIEVVVIVVGAGIVIAVFKHTGTLDVRRLRNLKG